MQHVTKNLPATLSDATSFSSPSQTTTKQPTSDFSQHERDLTGYLFAKLMVLYQHNYTLVWPSSKEVNLAKREWAKEIGKYTRDQVDEVLKHLTRLMVGDNKLFHYPSIPAVLGLLSEFNVGRASHKLFLPQPQETEEQKAARKKVANESLGNIRAMLDISEQRYKGADQSVARQRLREAEQRMLADSEARNDIEDNMRGQTL